MVFDEPLGWQGKVHQHVITDDPRPFPGISKFQGIVVADPQSLQVSHFRTGQFPLFPEEDPQPPDDPAVEFLKKLLGETYPKVVQPPRHKPIEFVYDAL